MELRQIDHDVVALTELGPYAASDLAGVRGVDQAGDGQHYG